MKNNEIMNRAGTLLAEMVMELNFRGCEDHHPLIIRAGELIPLLKSEPGLQLENPDLNGPGRVPDRLHFMTAEAVSRIDLTDLDSAGLAPHTREELAEAAFTFENEFMALLGDDNTMPIEAYSGMGEDELKTAIRTAADNICRLRSS